MDQNTPSQPPDSPARSDVIGQAGQAGQNPPLKPPPENLPTKETTTPIGFPPSQVSSPSPPAFRPAPPTVAPSQPISGSGDPAVSIPRPFTPAPLNQPQTAPPPPAPTTGQPPPLKSSIRTMEDDLAALKRVQALGLASPPKLSETPKPLTPLSPAPKVAPPILPIPPTPPRAGISPKIELGKLTPVAPPVSFTPPAHEFPKAVPVPPHPLPEKPADASLNVPPSRRFSLRSPAVLITALVLLAVVGFSAWFFLFYRASGPGVGLGPTPIATLTPMATPLPPLETVFSKTNVVTIALSENFFAAFEGPADAASIGLGETWLYKIDELGSGRRHSLGDFSGGTAIQVPADLLLALDDQEFYLVLMRKTDDKISYGFITKVADRGGANAALRNWEVTMPNNLKTLFGLDVTKAATPTFLDNMVSFPSAPIRYRNFPRADLTIDYAIVPAPNGENYLVFTNSREHIFNIIDKILTIGTALGK